MTQKKILFFMNANNYHSIKWAKYFAGQGYSVHIASFERCTSEEMLSISGACVHWLKNASDRKGGDFQKLGYLLTVGQAKQLIKQVSPDIIHAHFASSYGLICSLSAPGRFFLSVWGNDVYVFPNKSIIHRFILKCVLNSNCTLMSTSNAMALEAGKYTSKEFTITPFGVDADLFRPRAHTSRQSFVVGTVKALEKKYGIDVLIRAFAVLVRRHPNEALELRVAGTGSEEENLKRLAVCEGIDDCVVWLGFISQEDAAEQWASFDVAVVPSVSESESFGVAAVEAQSCGTPLVISDIPGLVEACDMGSAALVVKRGNVGELADAIDRLRTDVELRNRLAKKGRENVLRGLTLNDCFSKVDAIYRESLAEMRKIS